MKKNILQKAEVVFMPTLRTVLGIEEITANIFSFFPKISEKYITKYLNAPGTTDTMEDVLFPTGTPVFDALLSGYEGGVLTALYGPAGTGKTTICLLAAIAAIRAGKKVIFVDTEGGFSTVRFQQLLQNEAKEQYLEKIFLLKPMTFGDQTKTIARLREVVNEKIGLIIVDSVSSLYRVEIAKHEGVKAINADLGLQLYYLSSIARKYTIPVLVTSQVYADFEERDKVRMVGGDIIKNGAKCLLEIEKYKTVRKATVIKHRSLPEHRSIVFEITENGFTSFEEPKKIETPQSIHQKKSVSEEIAARFPELKNKKEFEEAGNVG